MAILICIGKIFIE